LDSKRELQDPFQYFPFDVFYLFFSERGLIGKRTFPPNPPTLAISTHFADLLRVLCDQVRALRLRSFPATLLIEAELCVLRFDPFSVKKTASMFHTEA